MTDKLYGERWKVVRDLVPGGQSWTYVVENIANSDGRQYVLKKLKNLDRIERFAQEIRTIQSLDHANVVRLVDSRLDGERPYLVTEYCSEGELTFERLSRFSTIQKLRIFQAICAAVGHAHDKGVIHRDIKPPNILLREDGRTPVVADFGICYVSDEGLNRQMAALTR